MEEPQRKNEQQHTSYDYATRDGVLPISWQAFGDLARTLAERLAPYGIEMVVGVARGGLIPATAVACALDCDMTPVRITRREQGKVVRERPAWKVDVAADVTGRVVAVIDDMASTGESLAMVGARVQELGAREVVLASLCAHSWANPMPQAVALTSDALVSFPWDYEIFTDGAWRIHPEYADALRAQGLDSTGK